VRDAPGLRQWHSPAAAPDVSKFAASQHFGFSSAETSSSLRDKSKVMARANERRQLAASSKRGQQRRGSTGEITGNNSSLEAGVTDAGFYGTLSSAVESPGKFFRETAHWLEASEDTDPVRVLACCVDDFKARKLKGPFVLVWLLLQAVGIMYQYSLLGEVSQHLSDYEDVLARYCGPEHQRLGVCLGPSWNLSYSEMLTFPPMQASDEGSDFDFVIPSDQPFEFQTKSKPSTFLVGVEPQKAHAQAQWRVTIASKSSSGSLNPMWGNGQKFSVVTSKVCDYQDSCVWSGSVSLKSKFSDAAQIHLYVVDSCIEHLEQIHAQEQCSFEKSWQNFNERHNGEHHSVLMNTQRACSFFLLVSVSSFVLMLYRFWFYIEGGKLLSRLIAFKFVVQDFPQQLCVVAYLYGWYASNGLRCQMCLFHPDHCDDEHPLHSSNFLMCTFTLLSAVSNQLLLQPKAKRYDEEEECCLWCTRGVFFSMSVLPFSTAIFFLSGPLLHLRSSVVYVVAGIPTLVGWGTLLCVPMFTLCDDEF